MNDRKFTFLTLSFIVVSLGAVVGLNYMVDPYEFYGHNLVKIKKTQQIDQLRLSKVVGVEAVSPRSVVFGTSRAEFGFDPAHEYFVQPAYNLSVGGSSVYEARLYIEHAIANGSVEKLLFVADYIMFNSNKQKRVEDLESYFKGKNLYSYLFNFQTTRSSLKTFRGQQQKKFTIYEKNGQRERTHNARNIRRFGGQERKVGSMTTYFSSYDNNNRYRDTGKNSFEDFADLLRLAYENDIEMDIVFGPNHVLHWESLDYFVGLDKWFQWKKDILVAVENAARQFAKPAFPVFDFSIYHEYTAEKFPEQKNGLMVLHWELNHYKSELGDLVMDRLVGNDTSFGVKLSLDNIDDHIESQRLLRSEYIDVSKYRQNVLVDLNRGNYNQYILRDFES